MPEFTPTPEPEKVVEGKLVGHEAHRLLTFRPLGSGGGVGVWWELAQAAKLFDQPGPSLYSPGSEELNWRIDENGGAEIRFQETTIGVMFYDDRRASKGMRAGETSVVDHDLTFKVDPDGRITSVTTTGEEEEAAGLGERIAKRRALHAQSFIGREPNPQEVEALLKWDLPDQEVMARLIGKLKKDGGKVPLGAWIKDWLGRKAGHIKDSLV